MKYTEDKFFFTVAVVSIIAFIIDFFIIKQFIHIVNLL